MDPITAVKSCFRKYATFSGRSARSEYWYFKLFEIISSYVFFYIPIEASFFLGLSHRGLFTPPAIAPALPQPEDLYPFLIYVVWWLAIMTPALAVTVRRLHDIDRSGWWWWLNFIPFAGAIWLLYWECTEGTRGGNRFGADPLPPDREPMVGPVEAIKIGFAKYVTFSGRATRAEFWFWTMFNAVTGSVVGIILMVILAGVFISEGAFEKNAPPPHPAVFLPFLLVGAIWWLIVFLPTVAVGVRRLHDIGRTGWLYWLYCIPLVGLVLLFVWNCERGTNGPNRYGRDPLAQW